MQSRSNTPGRGFNDYYKALYTAYHRPETLAHLNNSQRVQTIRSTEVNFLRRLTGPNENNIEKLLRSGDEIATRFETMVREMVQRTESKVVLLTALQVLVTIAHHKNGLLSKENIVLLKEKLCDAAKSIRNLNRHYSEMCVPVRRQRPDSRLGFDLDAQLCIERVVRGPGAGKPGSGLISDLQIGSRITRVDQELVYSHDQFVREIGEKLEFKLFVQYDNETSKYWKIIASILEYYNKQAMFTEIGIQIGEFFMKDDDFVREVFYLLNLEEVSFTPIQTRIHSLLYTICAMGLDQYRRQIVNLVCQNGYDTTLKALQIKTSAKSSKWTDEIEKLFKRIEMVKEDVRRMLAGTGTGTKHVKLTDEQVDTICEEVKFNFEKAKCVPDLIRTSSVEFNTAFEALKTTGFNLEEAKRKVITTEQKIKFCCLQSDPLIIVETDANTRKMTTSVPAALDFAAEEDTFITAFQTSKFFVDYEISILTLENLHQAECHILHLSGHGLPDTLILEDGNGGSKMHAQSAIRNFAQYNRHLKLVFVSMCHSESIAQLFVNWGIPHVIGVENQEKVKDASAIKFAKIFYYNLFKKELTVRKAFESAYNIFAMDQEGIPLKLLPDIEGRHDVKIRELIPSPRMTDTVTDDNEHVKRKYALMTKVPFRRLNLNFESVLDHYSVYKNIYHVKTSRILMIHSPPWVGRENMTAFTAHFVARLGIFHDGVVFIRCDAPIRDRKDFLSRIVEGLGKIIEAANHLDADLNHICHFLDQQNQKKIAIFITDEDSNEIRDWFPAEPDVAKDVIDVVSTLNRNTKVAICMSVDDDKVTMVKNIAARGYDSFRRAAVFEPVGFLDIKTANKVLLANVTQSEKSVLLNSHVLSANMPPTVDLIQDYKNFATSQGIRPEILKIVLREPSSAALERRWTKLIQSKYPDSLEAVRMWIQRIQHLRQCQAYRNHVEMEAKKRREAQNRYE